MRFLSTLAASVLGTLLALGIVLFFVFFFFFAIALSSDTTPTVEPGSVLTVPIQGSIPERTSQDPFQKAFQSGPSYDLRDLQSALRAAEQDDRVEAVWLRMKGTSASWGTLEEVRAAIMDLKESGTPVVASSEEFAMSEKDYYVASAADSVFAGPQTTFEYNGFTTIVSFYEDALDKLNVEPEVIRAGKYKSAIEPFIRSDLSEPNRQQLTALQTTINDQFLGAVSTARSISVADLTRLSTSDALLTVSRALEEGLIDGLRYEDEVRTTIDQMTGPSGGALSTMGLDSYSRVPPSEAGINYTGSGQVAVVYGQGNIVSGSPSESPLGNNQQVLGSSPLIDALETARTSASTQAVVLRINSPGGSAAASEAMWKAVERTAADKPLVVSMGDVAASGGYYIAAPADTIVANETTVTGSIGVFGLLLNARGLFENKLGVTFDEVSTSPYADMFSPTGPLGPRETQLMEQYVDHTYTTFLERVAAGRAMDTSAVHDVAQGRVWSGQDAKDVGLVDTTGTLADAIAMAGDAAGLGDGPYRVQELPRPKTFAQRLSENFASQATQLWHSVASTPLERTMWREARVLDRLVGTNGKAQARLPYSITVQ
jgi:protease-4